MLCDGVHKKVSLQAGYSGPFPSLIGFFSKSDSSGNFNTIHHMAQVSVQTSASRLRRAAAHLSPIKTRLSLYEGFSEVSLVSAVWDIDEGVFGQCDIPTGKVANHPELFNDLKRLAHKAYKRIQRDLELIFSTILIVSLFAILVYSISSFPRSINASRGASSSIHAIPVTPNNNRIYARLWAPAREVDAVDNNIPAATRGLPVYGLQPLSSFFPPKQDVVNAILVAPSGVASAKFRPHAQSIADSHSHSDHLGQLFGGPTYT